jgi:DNA-binding transcriptional ArsR family regulator
MVNYTMLLADSAALDATFFALADATRRAILARLSKGDATVLELAKPFDMTQAAVSKHLKVLERAGLISRAREAQRRPSHLEAKPLERAARWIATYQEFWEASYERLDDYLQELQTKEPRHVVKKTGNRRRTR